MKTDIIAIQKHVGVAADGIIGPRTIEAIRNKLGIARIPVWPTQAEVRRGNSIFGRAGCEADLVPLTPPYPLYYEGSAVRSIRVHRLIAKHVQSALEEVLAHYGQENIHRLGLDLYGGSYNYRSTQSGGALSMHAWGIALDFSPAANALHYKAPRATLSHAECRKWWEIWESHGAVSLGRECDYDWMHLQFARLK
ncbi:MAG: M15 family metallopeptidase [Akkermansiaceae bacterium]|nr:M15 family metallopeptidase [Akkermansiaceae bacterium]